MEESEKIYPKFKTHIILPFLFALTLSIAILFITIDDFTLELSGLIVWFYFGVCLLYCIMAIIDLYLNKGRSKKQFIFILIMDILTILVTILYAVFYLIARSK